MSAPVAAGAWVRVHAVLLGPEARAEQVPEETRAVPLEMTAKGFLTHDAAIGDEVEITTPAGRRLRGTLAALDPAYEHGFGAPVPELTPIGRELRALLSGKGAPR